MSNKQVSKITLSKSDYMLFLRHPAWLWLKKFDKAKLPPIDEDTQILFESGHVFENYAEQLFPKATKLGFSNYDEYVSLPLRTNSALESGAETVFQGRFEADGLTCIVDVLSKNPDSSFDLIEIKASTKVKPEHEYDLAFQLLVLEKSGLKIRNIAVMHANKKYVRDGKIDVQQFITKTDITDSVRALSGTTLLQVDKAKKVLSQSNMPDISPRYINQLNISSVTSSWLEEWLVIFESLTEKFSKYSIYNLAYPSPKQLGELEDLGITTIDEVSEKQCLRDKQAIQIKTTKSGERVIVQEKIKAFLDTFKYPLYFFDYETMSSVIPQFDGMSPYQDYPFQYSLHVIDKPDGEVKHVEYLHDQASNPMPGLLKQLQADIGESGTVLTWNMCYEKGCNDRMASLCPKYADFLGKLNERIEDLMTPFSMMWFFDKDFFGSASIKKVLPVLIPELSYKELNISDGLLARRLWTQTVLECKNESQRTQFMADLSKYCTLDTYAMVRILDELKIFCSQ